MRSGTRIALVALLLVAVFAGGVALSSWLSAPQPVTAAMGEDPNHRTITVSGVGEVTVAPNACRFTVGVVTQATTAVAAQAANNRAAQAVADQLKALGIKETDIQSVSLYLYPVYDDRKDPDYSSDRLLNPVGFRCTHRIQVTVRDLAKVGQAIDGAIQAGANTADDITYFVSETAELRQQALTGAVRQARAKADTIAVAAGVTIVEIKSIVEHGVDYGYYRSPMMYDSASGGASMPVLPGEVSIRASITMVVRY